MSYTQRVLFRNWALSLLCFYVVVVVVVTIVIITYTQNTMLLFPKLRLKKKKASNVTLYIAKKKEGREQWATGEKSHRGKKKGEDK